MDMEEQLIDAAETHRKIEQHFEESRKLRNEVIIEAIARGWTDYRIAEVTGISRMQIGNIRSKKTGK